MIIACFKKTMRIKKAIAILCLTFSMFIFLFTPTVKAYWGIADWNITDMVSYVADYGTWMADLGSWFEDISTKILNGIQANMLLFNKMAALYAVQTATSLIIGDGGDSKGGTIIRDFNSYLFTSPHQKAMTQMNSFFNTVSRGRLSSLNYEGVGPNIDSYLVTEAKKDITGKNFNTTLPEITPDQKQLFAGGNMKGIMTYMQCANNVACYTLNSTAKYNSELAKATELAKAENVNGFIPKKTNGRISQPAAIAQSALSQLDQLGKDVIMNAQAGPDGESLAAIEQVWIGAGISATARLTNYGISDEEGKAAIRNKNDEFPFSVGYSASGGIGFNAGGVNINTGAGAINGSVMIGNTCASLGAGANGAGATVDINGKKYNCATKLEVGATAPSISVTLPKITCVAGTVGDAACAAFGSFKCGPTGSCIAK